MIDNLKKTEKNNLILLYKEDFANFFNISFDGENYKFNINKNLYFSNFNEISPTYFYKYEVIEGDNWSTISYQEYGTIDLWWLICRVNQIWKPINNPVPGTILKILNKDTVNGIISNLEN